jgi:hypothetical protein
MQIKDAKPRGNQRALARPAPEKKPSKLSRLVPRDTIVGTLDDLDQGLQELDDEMRTASKNKRDRQQ